MTPRAFARVTDAGLSTGLTACVCGRRCALSCAAIGGTFTHFPFRQDRSSCLVIRALVAQHLGWMG